MPEPAQQAGLAGGTTSRRALPTGVRLIVRSPTRPHNAGNTYGKPEPVPGNAWDPNGPGGNGSGAPRRALP